MTEGGVATTGAQLLAQVMASDVGRRMFIRMSIEGAVLRFRPKDIYFWIDPMSLSCAALKRALLKSNRLDSPKMLVDRKLHVLKMAAAVLCCLLGSY